MDKQTFLTQLAAEMPLAIGAANLSGKRIGLVVVDPVQGFCDFGALADPVSMAPMIEAVDRLARQLTEAGANLRVLVFRDAHRAEVPEPPYPPHCVIGTGEELITPRLAWLALDQRALVIDKDCINGFVGAIDVTTGANRFVDWVRGCELDALLVTGDCTDICVLDFVVATLSARNHGLLGRLAEVSVYLPGVATYDLPEPEKFGLPPVARHPREVFHHAALAMMQRRGAALVDRVEV